jgi:hypothetical protein
MLRASYVPAWTSVVKRSLAGESLRFPEDLPTFEDYELYVRLARIGLAAYLDCSTAINHGHEGPRLGGVDHVTKAMTQLIILSRNFGRDVTYLRWHRREFETAVAALSHYRLKELVIRGDTKQARHDMKTIEGVPASTRILSLFPGAVARAVYKLYSAAVMNTDPERKT